MRATDGPDRRHRWSRRHTTTTVATVARIASAAGSALPDPQLKPISFADVRRQPDPEWSRPAAAAARRQAYAAADADYTALTPLAMALAPIIARLDKTPATVDWADALDAEWAGITDGLDRLVATTLIVACYQSQRDVIAAHRALLDDIDMVPLDAIRVRQAFAPVAAMLAEVAV